MSAACRAWAGAGACPYTCIRCALVCRGRARLLPSRPWHPAALWTQRAKWTLWTALCCAFVHAVHTVQTKVYDVSTHGTLNCNLTRNVFTSDELIGWHPIFFTAQRPQSRGLIFFE